jgi:hypothetical protein
MALSIVGTAVAAGLAQLGLRAPIAGPAPR